MKEPYFEHAHPVVKLLFLFFIILVSFFIVLSVGIVLAIPLFQVNLLSIKEALNINNPENIAFIKYMQLVQHIGIFILPPFIVAFIFSKQTKKYLHFKGLPEPQLFLFGILTIIFALPFIQYTGALNSGMTLPESFAGLEAKIRAMEEAAAKATEILLNAGTPSGLFVNLLIIALVPAIGEELMFRGVLLNLFKEWTKSKHFAVILSAFIFSTIHLQFFGFLPRFLLGVLFGYLFVWSGNILIPISLHFVNNATAVCVYYFLHGTDLYEKTESMGTESLTSPALFFSVFLTALFIYLFYRHSRKVYLSKVS